MRRAPTTFLLTLCFFAALCEGAAAQGRTKTRPQPGGATAEAVGSLVSLLKKARAYTMPRTQSTQRLSGVRAEGCVLRYNVVTEYESPNYHSQGAQAPSSFPSDRPMIVSSDYRLFEREIMVNLSDLDAARVRVRVENQLKRESGGSVIFGASNDKESVRERGPQYSRLGMKYATRWSKNGSFPVGDDGSLETVAAALKRAVEVCAPNIR